MFLQPLLQLLVEHPATHLVIALQAQVKGNEQDIFRIETHVDRTCVGQADQKSVV